MCLVATKLVYTIFRYKQTYSKQQWKILQSTLVDRCLITACMAISLLICCMSLYYYGYVKPAVICFCGICVCFSDAFVSTNIETCVAVIV